MTGDPYSLIVPWIERARHLVAATGSIDRAIIALAADIDYEGDADRVAAIALIQLAADEDFAGVTR